MASTAVSAGLVILRGTEILLGHPGGPFWANKDDGAWSIPKGLLEPGEDALAAAIRETSEELGIPALPGPFAPLGEIRMKSGKRIVAFATRADIDVTKVKSNEIEIDWPPRSGKKLRIPEIDRALYVSLERARVLVIEAQIPLLERALSSETAAKLGAT